MKHKITTKVSLKYADTLEMTCTCGWTNSVGKYTFSTNSMRVVRAEARYLKQDHLDEQKVAA
jgi:hypothetical protein